MQKHVSDEALSRSLACHWDDIPAIQVKQNLQDPIEAHLRRFDRESTPKNLHNVKFLDTIMEEEVKVEEAPHEMRSRDVSALFGGPLGLQTARPQRFFGQHV